NHDGFLMLGRSETAKLDDMFSPIDGAEKIYTKKEGAKRLRRVHAAKPHGSADAGKIAAPARIAALPDLDMGKAVDRLLLSKYSPAAVLVDEGLEVLEIRGDAAPFFRLPVGKVSFHLLK